MLDGRWPRPLLQSTGRYATLNKLPAD